MSNWLYIGRVSKVYRWAIAFGLLLVALSLRFEKFEGRPFYPDELNQINSTYGPLLPFWQRLTYSELTSFPGDYVITYPFVQWFGKDARWGLVIPHIFSTLLGFWFLYLLCNRYMKTWIGWLIPLLIVCWNNNLIFHAFELRPYAVMPTLALISFWLSEPIISEQPWSMLHRWGVGVFFVFTVFFHAYGILMVFFPLSYFLFFELMRRGFRPTVQKNWRFLLGLSAFAIPVFLWYATAQNSAVSQESFASRNIDTFQYIPSPITNLIGFLKGVVGNLVGRQEMYWSLGGLVLAFILPHGKRIEQALFLGWMVVVPIALICIVDVRTGYWFVQRQFIWIMPLFALFLGWCWDKVVDFSVQRIKKV